MAAANADRTFIEKSIFFHIRPDWTDQQKQVFLRRIAEPAILDSVVYLYSATAEEAVPLSLTNAQGQVASTAAQAEYAQTVARLGLEFAARLPAIRQREGNNNDGAEVIAIRVNPGDIVNANMFGRAVALFANQNPNPIRGMLQFNANDEMNMAVAQGLLNQANANATSTTLVGAASITAKYVVILFLNAIDSSVLGLYLPICAVFYDPPLFNGERIPRELANIIEAQVRVLRKRCVALVGTKVANMDQFFEPAANRTVQVHADICNMVSKVIKYHAAAWYMMINSACKTYHLNTLGSNTEVIKKIVYGQTIVAKHLLSANPEKTGALLDNAFQAIGLPSNVVSEHGFEGVGLFDDDVAKTAEEVNVQAKRILDESLGAMNARLLISTAPAGIKKYLARSNGMKIVFGGQECSECKLQLNHRGAQCPFKQEGMDKSHPDFKTTAAELFKHLLEHKAYVQN